MRELSCRAMTVMPDGVTEGRYDTEHFGPLALLENGKDWGERHAPAGWVQPLPEDLGDEFLLDIAGFNMRTDGWQDDALSSCHETDSRLWGHAKAMQVAPIEVIPGLWVGRGQSAIQKIQFHLARQNVRESVLYFGPFLVSCANAGKKIHVLGHSCGGYMAPLLAEYMAKRGVHFESVTLMNAAMRQSEWTPDMIKGSTRWLNFFSLIDKALEAMRFDPVDENDGWWGAIKQGVQFKWTWNEHLVGTHGIPSGDATVTNVDLTNVIHGDHSAARRVPWVMRDMMKFIRA